MNNAAPAGPPGVDSAFTHADGASVIVDNGEALHFTLVRVNLATNTDKYYVGQCICVQPGRPGAGTWFFSRWGRSGSAGQCLMEGPLPGGKDEAKALFAAKFAEKTGVAWAARQAAPAVPGKYQHVQVPPAAGGLPAGKWQFQLDTPQDGLLAGWHDYEPAASASVDAVFRQWQGNHALSVRCVQSGKWAYRVDFNTMT